MNQTMYFTNQYSKLFYTFFLIGQSTMFDDGKPLDAAHLRIIEYTKIGYRAHSIYPSAAISLNQSTHFDASNPTVIFVHGFTDSPMLETGRAIATAFLKKGNFNVLALDASAVIKSMYVRSATMAKYIGEYLSFFLYDLTRVGVNPETLHVIGHSLGAHISGYAGKGYQILKPGEKLPRITGLDPANPCFYDTAAENRLSSSDAHFVDIIHSNIGVYGLNVSIGLYLNVLIHILVCILICFVLIGHVDFYPNGGGPSQPGCNTDTSCSHARAWEFFVESINNPESFVALQCDSWGSFSHHMCTENQRGLMGYYTPNGTRGNFYLVTNNVSPYGLGEKGILVH